MAKQAIKNSNTASTVTKIGKYRVGVCTARGIVDCVVVSERRVSKGRRAGMIEYTLAALDAKGFGGTTYAMTVWGRDATGCAFLGNTLKAKWTEAQVNAAVARFNGTRSDIGARKAAKVEAGNKVLGSVVAVSRRAPAQGVTATAAIAIGDIVGVQYSNRFGLTNEVVIGINTATGKIAIERPARFGMRHMQKMRWITASVVKTVTKPVKALPYKLLPKHLAEIKKNGVVNIRLSNGEFITSSYVVATTAEVATQEGKRKMLDSSDTKTYKDAELGLFWVNTGFFD
jgi:hypothetical protein